MMWDFSGGSAPPNNYPQASHYQGSPSPSFPMPGTSPLPPAPFMPIGMPGPQFPSPLPPSSYSSSYSGEASPWPYGNPPPAARSPVVDMHYHHSSQTHHAYVHQTTHSSSNPSRPVHQSQGQAKPHKHKPPPTPTQAVQPAVQSSHSHSHRPSFQYSKCTGKRRALCIGINYTGKPYTLRGCVNDAKNVKRFLISHHNYKDGDIILLVDDAPQGHQPTRRNIIAAMEWLVKDACPNDSLFFHFSGHGSQVKDKDGDEVDGYDEVILPLDYERNGIILDDLMHAIMVKPLPAGCRLTALFDSCHSGSVLDLPYLYSSNGRVKGSQVTAKHFKAKSTNADVISWSGCKDNQTSADTFEAGSAAGAMSYAFMKSIHSQPVQSYQDLLRSIRKILKEKYSQRPQLSSSHHIDTNLQFIM